MPGDCLLKEFPERWSLGAKAVAEADLLDKCHEGLQVGPNDGGGEVPDDAQDVWHGCNSTLRYPEP